LYRPFTKKFYYFERIFNEDLYHYPKLFPTPETELENQVISLHGLGMSKPFFALVSQMICDVQLTPNGQTFPFYVYDKEGKNREENIRDWALQQFQTIYQDKKISKWDIFYYIYGLLHHPTYRENYSANLRLELPHIPFVKQFWALAAAGKQLAELHLYYEQQNEYPLQFLENPELPLSWRVEKMQLSKDKTSLVYNNFLTLAGIPPEVFNYKLGNRSALEWVIEQYQLTTDKRSGMTNNPNRPDDPQYIVRLVGQIITVSLETLKIIQQLPPLEIIHSNILPN
jgi:predicted helicase